MTPDESARGKVEEIRRRQRPWRMDDIETLLDRITALEAQRDEARANADFLRESVGECHMMISRDTPEYQIKTTWESTDLPPRFQKIMRERAQARRELEQQFPPYHEMARQRDDARREAEAAKAEGAREEAAKHADCCVDREERDALLATARRLRDALVLVGKAYDLAEEENTLGDLYRRMLASPDVQALGRE